MGMFDYLRTKYPLTQNKDLNEELFGLVFQSKDTPAQCLDEYEIREDGSLWYQDYDASWVDEPGSFFGGYLNQENHRWEKCNITGSIDFHADRSPHNCQWIEFRATFVDGVVSNIEQLETNE